MSKGNQGCKTSQILGDCPKVYDKIRVPARPRRDLSRIQARLDFKAKFPWQAQVCHRHTEQRAPEDSVY